MKTKRRHYRNKKKTFRKKSKYNKRGGIWGWDITGRKNVNSTRYRELKNTEKNFTDLQNEYNNMLRENKALKEENKTMMNTLTRLRWEDSANRANATTMRDLHEENKNLK
jgi:hypothetical protein